MPKKRKVNVRRRTNTTQFLKKNWDNLNFSFNSINEYQSSFKKNLELIVKSIFSTYKENGFKNDKNLRLTKTFFLLRNIMKGDGRFIETLQDARETLISNFNDILQGIYDTEISSENLESLDLDKESNGDQENHDYSEDVIEILYDVISGFTEEKNNRENEEKSKNDIKKDDGYEKNTVVKEENTYKESKNENKKQNGILKKIANFIFSCIDEYGKNIKKSKKKIILSQSLSFTGTNEQSKILKGKETEKNKIDAGISKQKQENKSKVLLNLEKTIIKNNKLSDKRQNFICITIEKLKNFSKRAGLGIFGFFGRALKSINPLNIISKVLGMFSIFGFVGAVGSLISSTFKFATSIVKGIFSISKKIITSVFSLAGSLVRKLTSSEFRRIIMSPTGMFISGFVSGFLVSRFKKHLDLIHGVKEKIVSVFNSAKQKVKNFFDKWYPSLNYAYESLIHNSIFARASDFFTLFKELLKSFTPAAFIRSGIKAAGAWAIGKLTFAAVKAALAGASTAAAASGVGLPLAVIGFAALALTEIGTILWERWSVQHQKNRVRRFLTKTGDEQYREKHPSYMKAFTQRLSKWEGTSIFAVKNRRWMLSLFNKEGKLERGFQYDKNMPEVKSQYLGSLFQKIGKTIDLDAPLRIEKETEKVNEMKSRIEARAKQIEEERESIMYAVSLMTGESAKNLEELYHDQVCVPAIDLYINGQAQKRLDMYHNPLQVRIYNLLAYQETLQKLVTRKDYYKYLDNPDQFDKDFEEEIKKQFSRGGQIEADKAEVLIRGESPLSLGINPQTVFGKGQENAKGSVYKSAQKALANMNASLQKSQAKVQSRVMENIERTTSFSVFTSSKDKDENFLLTLIFEGQARYEDKSYDKKDVLERLLNHEHVKKILKERGIDLSKKDQTTWRNFINFWLSQNSFVDSYMDIFHLRHYLDTRNPLSGRIIATKEKPVHPELSEANAAAARGDYSKITFPTIIEGHVPGVVSPAPSSLRVVIVSINCEFCSISRIDQMAVENVTMPYSVLPSTYLDINLRHNPNDNSITNSHRMDNMGTTDSGFGFSTRYSNCVTNLQLKQLGFLGYYGDYGDWIASRPNVQNVIEDRKKLRNKYFRDDNDYHKIETDTSRSDFVEGMFNCEQDLKKPAIFGQYQFCTGKNLVYSEINHIGRAGVNKPVGPDVFIKHLNFYFVHPDEKLTSVIIEYALNSFVDFIYPFLKTYLDNKDKANTKYAKTYEGMGGGSIGKNLDNFVENLFPSLGRKIKRGLNGFIGDEEDQKKDPRQLNRELMEQHNKNKKRLQDLQKQKDGTNKENKEVLEKSKSAIENIEEQEQHGSNEQSRTRFSVVERENENKNNLAELRKKSEDRRESRC